jgi:cation transport ATPase
MQQRVHKERKRTLGTKNVEAERREAKKKQKRASRSRNSRWKRRMYHFIITFLLSLLGVFYLLLFLKLFFVPRYVYFYLSLSRDDISIPVFIFIPVIRKSITSIEVPSLTVAAVAIAICLALIHLTISTMTLTAGPALIHLTTPCNNFEVKRGGSSIESKGVRF